ncbi:lipopolysaccharide biosynthesis protein [Trichlorobacter lovleyi]|uniref:Polysaccharide biosynthesis protein n=1 Tax=Trichlorobacter lovleyi (strain ATCC BAA-1151 / DSM 17278 / SZ) TaxID=398767 RepID=B3E8V2_TRIL1|nr:oligosaccharide flippase family protein [Trichlorobacter lovleyi]ACD95220.1 polysaccharide biosynthesis protein [Trichlorobacter lovleyi SZ]
MLKLTKPKSEFARNVITLMTGTTIAQIIPIAISPILSRLYSPADFGLFAFYMSIVGIISVIATGRYEMAIMMPSKDEDDEVIIIVFVATVMMMLVTLICFVLFVVFNKQVASMLNRPEISGWLYIAPFSVIITGLYQTLNYLLIRQSKFKQLSINKVCFSAISGPSQVGLGLLGFGALGMLASNIGAYLITIWMIFRSSEIRGFFKPCGRKQAEYIAIKYIRYPKYDIPAILINIVSNQLPLLAMGKYLGLGLLGNYSLMNKIVMAPIGLISNSILDVFKQRATEDYLKHGNCKDIYIKVFFKLLMLGAVPTCILAFFAPAIFSFVFGNQWRDAGVIAQILAPSYLLNFLVNPLSYTFQVTQRQNLNLFFNVLFFVMMTSAVVLGVKENNHFRFIFYISVVQCVNYSIYLYVSYRLARGGK